jgi:uncharacterized protein (DUF1330 family)
MRQQHSDEQGNMVAYYMMWNRDATNPEALTRYVKQAAASVEFYGGKFASLCGKLESADGTDLGHRVVAIEFPSMTIAREWYGSSRYEAARSLSTMLRGFSSLFLDGVSEVG